MGRNTYEIFSRQWPAASGPYADFLNRIPKYVFSSTLDEARWENTSVVSGDVVAGVRELKEAAGDDLLVYGHGRFGQTLVDAGLVDELSLTVVPVFVPAGTPLFRDGGAGHRWELVRAGEGYDPGLASLTYRPAASTGRPADVREV
jgi:dihydrofolate reductase